MSRVSSVLACTALIAACQSSDSPTAPAVAAPAPEGAVIHTRQRITIIEDAVIENPCNGEQMRFHFNELFLVHDLELEGKAFHTHVTSMDRGSSGVGLTTGSRYRQVGAQTSTFISGGIDEAQTFVIAGAVIGQGGAPSFRAHQTFHLTVTPDGTVRVELDRFRFACR